MQEKFGTLFFAIIGTGLLLFSYQNCGSLGHIKTDGSQASVLSKDSGPDGKALLKDMVGVWQKPCTELNPTESKIKFRGDGRGQLFVDIGKENCEPILSATVQFKFQLGEKANEQIGDKVFRLKASNLENGNIIPRNESVAQAFRNAHYCGVADWQVDQPRRVRFDQCRTNNGQVLEKPFLSENLVQISKKGLRLGQSGSFDDFGYPQRLEVFAYQKVKN